MSIFLDDLIPKFNVMRSVWEKQKKKKCRTLTLEAQVKRDRFVGLYGTGNCSCHISPPCCSCTHEGNPKNQEDEENYEYK